MVFHHIRLFDIYLFVKLISQSDLEKLVLNLFYKIHVCVRVCSYFFTFKHNLYTSHLSLPITIGICRKLYLI